MSNKSNDSRRRLLKSITIGTSAIYAGNALPNKWAKPIVDSVVLPAHGQTTGCPSCTGPETSASDEGVIIYFVLLDSNTLRIYLGEDTVDASVTGEGDTGEGDFLYEAKQGCDGFVRVSGTITQGTAAPGTVSGTLAWNNGAIDADGDLCWGSGDFAGPQTDVLSWEASGESTETCCKAA